MRIDYMIVYLRYTREKKLENKKYVNSVGTNL